VVTLKDFIVTSIDREQIRKALALTFWKLVKKHFEESIKHDYKKVVERHPALILEKSSPNLGIPPTAFNKQLTTIRLAKALFMIANGEEPQNLNETEANLVTIILALLDLLDETVSSELGDNG